MDWSVLLTKQAPTSWPNAESFVAAASPGPPADRAVAGGVMADRLAYAFLAGYHAACDAVMGPSPWPAMCVTEEGPPHPRNIACRYADGALHGVKNFVTGGPTAKTLHVLAVAGETKGQRELVVGTVTLPTEGAAIEALAPPPFVPELQHGRVRFSGAKVDSVVEDGWGARIKPFRTVEDLHVTMAIAAYLARTLHRHGGSAQDVEAVAGLVFALHALAAAPADSPVVHRALAGVDALLRPIVERTELPGEEGERWARDRRLLRVAQSAREARAAAARTATGAVG